MYACTYVCLYISDFFANTLYMKRDVISNVNTSDRTPAGISIDSASYVDNVNVMKSNQCGYSDDPASEAGWILKCY